MDPTILVALIAAVPATIAALGSFLSARRAKEATVCATTAAHHAKNADDAVNHRGPDEPRLVELVKEIHAEQQTQGNRLQVMETAFLHHLVIDHDRGVST